MVVSKDKVVMIQYTLRDDQGQVLDATPHDDAFAYLHGYGNLILGLERALEGRSEGDAFEVSVPPEEAYGAHEPAGVIQVPRASLSNEVVVEVGHLVQAQGPEGRMEFCIAAFDDDTVTLDGNHPLAGKTLHFSVKVGPVRDAHADEIKHRRVHPAGHHLMVADSSFDESLLGQDVVDAGFPADKA